MALRRNIKHYTPTLTAKLLKWISLFLLFILCAVGGFILYFNGQNVKAPLLTLLNEHSQVKFNAQTVEFSPLYPNILKLEDVSVGKQGNISQLYLEYDIKSLLSGHILIIKELYAHGVTLPEQTLRTLTSQTLGFAGINVEKIRIEDANITLSPHLEAKGLSLSLQDVDLKANRHIEFQSGSLAIQEGKLDGIGVKNLSCNLMFLDDTLQAGKLQAEILSGSISGDFLISADGKEIDCEQLVLNNNVLKFPQTNLHNYQLNVPQAQIHNLVIVSGDELLLSGISGKVTDFKCKDQSFSGAISGRIEEISLPKQQLTFEENQIRFSRYDNFSSLRLNGTFLEGKFATNLDYDELNKHLKISELLLDGQKIEADEQNLAQLKSLISPLKIDVINAELKQVEFLSKFKTLPLSIKTINGSLKGFNWTDNHGFKGAPVGVADLQLQGILYHDLGVRQLKLLSNFSDDLCSLSLPEVKLNHSTVNLTASYSHLTHNSYLFVKAHDFDLSDLNCAMIPHLLDGKVNLELDLRGTQEWQKLPLGLRGYISVTGTNLLISKFGLDLINGGPSENYKLTSADLFEAMRTGDSGISKLTFNSFLDGSRANFTSTFNLPVSAVNVSGTLDLDDLNLTSKAYFISGPKDAVTIVNVEGALPEPEFRINAISRSEVRPGLYFTEEQTRSILNAELIAKQKERALRKLHADLKERAYDIEKKQQEALQQILPYGEKTKIPKAGNTESQILQLPHLSPLELDRIEQSILQNTTKP